MVLLTGALVTSLFACVAPKDDGCAAAAVDTGSDDCGERDTSADDDPDHDTGGDTGSPPAFDVVVRWGAEALPVQLTGAAEDRYFFGLVESLCCGDMCWTGEGCMYGYYDGESVVEPYCHVLESVGTSLTYGGDVYDLQAGTTVFPDDSFGDSVTFYLERDHDWACWAWGAQPAYYLDCAQRHPTEGSPALPDAPAAR